MSETSENKSSENMATQNNEGGVGDTSKAEVENLKAQLEKAKNDFLYLRAEFDTYKRNAIKESSDLRKYGAERVLVEFLNVLDNFERALDVKVTSDNVETFVKGVHMTAQEIRNLVSKFGVSEIPSHGEPFNPAHHEALSSEETSQIPEGHVSRVFKKPYKLHDKVIRTGQVVVAKKPTT